MKKHEEFIDRKNLFFKSESISGKEVTIMSNWG